MNQRRSMFRPGELVVYLTWHRRQLVYRRARVLDNPRNDERLVYVERIGVGRTRPRFMATSKLFDETDVPRLPRIMMVGDTTSSSWVERIIVGAQREGVTETAEIERLYRVA